MPAGRAGRRVGPRRQRLPGRSTSCAAPPTAAELPATLTAMFDVRSCPAPAVEARMPEKRRHRLREPRGRLRRRDARRSLPSRSSMSPIRGPSRGGLARGWPRFRADHRAERSGAAQRRRAGQGDRPAAHRHPALQRLPQRGRRVVAPAGHRSGRVGARAEPAGGRFDRRPGARAGRQFGHGGLPEPVGHGPPARSARCSSCRCRPRHAAAGRGVHRCGRRNPPPAAPVRRRLPEGAEPGVVEALQA